MTPTDLAAYLDVMKKAGVMSAKITISTWAEIAVTFAPDFSGESHVVPERRIALDQPHEDYVQHVVPEHQSEDVEP